MQSCEKPPAELATLASSCVSAAFLLAPGSNHSPPSCALPDPFSPRRSSLCCLRAHRISSQPSTHFWSGSEGPCSVLFTTVVSLLSLRSCGCRLGGQNSFPSATVAPPLCPQILSQGVLCPGCRVRMGSTVCKTKRGAVALREHAIGDQPQGSRKVQEPRAQSTSALGRPGFDTAAI